MQCYVNYTAKSFTVVVDQTNMSISVTLGQLLPWPDYGDAVLEKVTSWLEGFSYTDNAVGGSTLGRSLRVNVNELLKFE